MAKNPFNFAQAYSAKSMFNYQIQEKAAAKQWPELQKAYNESVSENFNDRY